MNILYISYDGVTDPLGQSQIIPYLAGLSAKGHQTTILSCEKRDNYDLRKDEIDALLQANNINWSPIFYHKSPPVLSTIYDIQQLKGKAAALHKQHNFDIVHCRSYLAGMVGHYMKKKFNTKFIFDIRGFWVDERVEGGLWNLSNPLYQLIYNYFKKKETQLYTDADHTVSLTIKGKEIIHSKEHIKNNPIPIEVIPCCADLDHFSFKNIDSEKVQEVKNELGITNDDFVISYLGSIGTWYMLDEMLEFFQQLLQTKPNSKFLFITNERSELIKSKAKEQAIPEASVITTKAEYQDVPTVLSLSDISIFFIKQIFSKNASSPTKQGEIMGMGIPIICNSKIGDTADILVDTDGGVVINDFTNEEYQIAIDKIDGLLENSKEHYRNGAFKYYSLKEGVEKYDSIYSSLSN